MRHAFRPAYYLLFNFCACWHFLSRLNILTFFRPSLRWLSILLLAAQPWAALKALGGNTNLNRFGFSGPEIFPIDNQLSQLRVADLDGDGLNDLIIVNNARSKINLLYNQTGKTNLPVRTKFSGRSEINDLPP